MAGGTSTSKGTTGVLATQQSLPWTQRNIYIDQRGNLPNCCWWRGYPAIGEPEGEPVTGGLEMRDRVPMWLRPGVGTVGWRG